MARVALYERTKGALSGSVHSHCWRRCKLTTVWLKTKPSTSRHNVWIPTRMRVMDQHTCVNSEVCKGNAFAVQVNCLNKS